MRFILTIQTIIMNNILVTGSNGQLGSEIREIALDYKEYTFLFTDISDLDITRFFPLVRIK